MRILVSGMLAGVPYHGGVTWVVLQYLLGFRRLGHEVMFVEPVDEAVVGSADDGADEIAVRDRYFHAVTERYGLAATALVDPRGRSVGVDFADVDAFARSADLLVNLSGVLHPEKWSEWIDRIPVRLYVDLDPGFTQIWADGYGIDMGFSGHTHFASVGGTLASDSSPVPSCGLDWIPTLPPVALPWWPFSETQDRGAFTTVANWRGYGSVEHQGLRYGQKAHAFRALADLPVRARESIEVALAIHPEERDDLALLNANQWRLRNPDEVARTPWEYETYVSTSRGELGIAKTGYVVGRTGWFSDRSACYLAAGRPVVAQDTGFAELLPVGRGLLSFSTADEAADALDRVAGAYEAHRRAAREIAEEYLDSDRVLSRLLTALTTAVAA